MPDSCCGLSWALPRSYKHMAICVTSLNSNAIVGILWWYLHQIYQKLYPLLQIRRPNISF